MLLSPKASFCMARQQDFAVLTEVRKPITPQRITIHAPIPNLLLSQKPSQRKTSKGNTRETPNWVTQTISEMNFMEPPGGAFVLKIPHNELIKVYHTPVNYASCFYLAIIIKETGILEGRKRQKLCNVYKLERKNQILLR